MKYQGQKSKDLGTVYTLLTFSFFTLLSFFSYSQQSGNSTVEVSKKTSLDTNYIKVYKNKLIIAIWGSERSFDITVAQKLKQDSGKSTINYVANSNHVTGISIDYDILSVSFGYKSVPSGNKRTGNTDYFDFGLNVNTKGLRFENTFKGYTGFYDVNTPSYTHPFTDTTDYFKNPSMNLKVIKSKVIYSFNKNKFALGAAYANTKRQIKTAGSWLLVGNFYALSMHSGSSFIPTPLDTFYGSWNSLHKMNIYAFSAGFGGTRTFVFWKRFYFNILASVGLESQYRHYYTDPDDSHYKYWKIWFANDWRTSLGYNGKNFFIRTSTVADITNYDSSSLKFKMKFVAASFDLGYRFNFKTPKPYKKFQESKTYKKYF